MGERHRNIIGLSSHYHDSACCLLRGGRIIAAAQEERFSRIKHDAGVPRLAFRYCLEEGGIDITDVDCVAYYEQPYTKIARQVWMLVYPWRPLELSLLSLEPGRVESDIRAGLGYEGSIQFVQHHEAHAASGFFFSGFPESAVMTVDGVGEWATTTYGYGKGAAISSFEEVHFPHSLGLLYSAMTSFLGFAVNDGEYKVMGLAPYGQPVYADKIRLLIDSSGGGQYRLDMRYFKFHNFERMYTDEFVELLGGVPRKRGEPITSFHQDVACSLQHVLEEILLEKVTYLHQKTASDNLCMAGGVALNCVANGRIEREGPFKRLFVQPSANDAGGALGAAALAHYRMGDAEPITTEEHDYLGPGFTNDEVRTLLAASGLTFEEYMGREADLLAAAVSRLAMGKVVAWFQGRMEFGPRALGARSILADPRIPDMRDRINTLVKKRETFRPFAPAVLYTKVREHFDLVHQSPFMLQTYRVNSPLSLPAITHVDCSARVQTVDGSSHPRFAALLAEFDRATGCPILLNTSFNLRDEPIVCRPADALACFLRSGIDALIIQDFVVNRPSADSMFQQVLEYEDEQTGAISDRIYRMF
jgi:carbamoyltransferase